MGSVSIFHGCIDVDETVKNSNFRRQRRKFEIKTRQYLMTLLSYSTSSSLDMKLKADIRIFYEAVDHCYTI